MTFAAVTAAAGRRRVGEAFGVAADAPELAPSALENGPFSPQTDACPELDCVRPLLPADVLAAAAERARRIGVGADRVLIAGGMIGEETYLRALCGWLGTAFEPLDGVEHRRCALTGARLIDGAATGLLPLTGEDGIVLVVAPQGTAARRLIAMIEANPGLAARFRLTTAERFNHFVQRHGRKALAARASNRLQQQWPALSAAPRPRRHFRWPLAAAGALAASIALWPAVAVPLVTLPLAAVFMAWLALRLAGAVATSQPLSPPPTPIADDALPVYSVVAALYREASSVNGLLAAIERLHYPPEKLDVILAIEPDDHETRAAIAARASRIPIAVVTAPATGPRTKPKALNAALPFARGTFTVIYDAEDRPSPDQLREAVHAFRRGGEKLVCVQAPLCIDNTADSWLTRMFTAEYAGQFDIFLPGLAALRLPLPLGGSSNHFRTAVLRAVGAWDPYNVTEDADLGMRLVRFGYRAGTIRATTYEEAPAHTGAWLRQRTRWFKGWMQTWLVHMRAPRRLLRDFGLPGFLAFQLIVGGSALSALVHPLFLAWAIYIVASGAPLWPGDSTADVIINVFFGVTAVLGYLVSGLLGWLGLKRRGISGAWVLVMTPVHWLLLSLAAWRALYQLHAAPYLWEKTEHGLARTSRRRKDLTLRLLDLERMLSGLQDGGLLPALGEPPHQAAKGADACNATDISAARRRLPRACA